MLNDKFSNVIYQEQDIVKLIYNGGINLIDCIIAENTQSIAQFKTASDLGFNIHQESELDMLGFDTMCQTDWFIPQEYKTLDIEGFLVDQCPKEHYPRLIEELQEFRARNMLPLLRVLKYVVDTLTQNNVLWGVGRGSSVASYVLFLIGVHKIDSIKYDLDWREFLR
jgi:DNA polymerase III alpha subunit